MFGFGKKKKCKCDEDITPKIEIHEIIVKDDPDTQDDILCELLSLVLTPYLNKICNKLNEEGKKDKKEQDIAFNKFKQLLEMKEDFDPWHIAALILTNKVTNSKGKKSDKKDNVKKKKNTDTRKPSTSSKASSKKK